MGFSSWIRKKREMKAVFPLMESITKEYQTYKKDYPNSSYEDALLRSVRWRFNRAFFGSEDSLLGSKLYGELPDDEILRILKERGVYDSIGQAAAFVAGLEMQYERYIKRGLDPSTWAIAKGKYNSSGSPWRPKSIEEMGSQCRKEIEASGLMIKGNETKLS